MSKRAAQVNRVHMALMVALCVGLGLSSPVMATVTSQTQVAAPASLLDLWLDMAQSGPVYGPYVYIRHNKTQAAQTQRKNALVNEIDELLWRLQAAGNRHLVRSLQAWQHMLDQLTTFRSPGRWGPALLLSSDSNGVPVTAIAAVGACRVPNWVEIWDAQGVRRVRWQAAMRLSSLLATDGPLQGANADHVALINAYGEIDTFGIGAWNEQDTPLSPGTRIVVPLPLEGQVRFWLQHTLAVFLARVPPADQCRQIEIDHGAAHAQR